MPSKLSLEWNQSGLPSELDSVVLRDGLAGSQLYLTFRALRQAQFQVTIGSFYAENRGNFRNAFLADYNQLNTYTVEYGGTNFLYITHPTNGHFQSANVSILTSGIIGYTVENTPDAPSFTIDDVAFLAAPNPCNDMIVQVTTSEAVARITSPIVQDNPTNPFQITWPRGTSFFLRMIDAVGQVAYQTVVVPTKLSSGIFNVSVVNSPAGATITIGNTGVSGVTLEYSLDNTNWQSSNTWTNITQGSYTAYIRDQYGCNVSVPFEVGDFNEGGVGVLYPVADLPPKSNSIIFFKVKDAGEFKNDENTASCDHRNLRNPKLNVQMFRSDNVITTQFRTNYENIEVKVLNSQGTETLLPVNQVSQNIGLKDGREAVKYEIEGGLTGFYFISGSLYDYDTQTDTGLDYTLNGGLPEWARVGNYVNFGGAWYEIVNQVFDKTKNAEVIIVNHNYTGIDVTEVVYSLYNAQQYEVYEAICNMGLFPDDFIKVFINLTDPQTSYPDRSFESEVIRVKSEFPRTIQMRYWNDENAANILYGTGIQHIIHIPIVYEVAVTVEEGDTEKTDTSAYLVEADVHEATEFRTGWVSRELMRKIALARNHFFVEINDVQFVREGEISSEPVLGTDFYKLTFTMLKAGNAYSTTPQDYEAGSEIEIPRLLEDNGTFLKYE